MKELSTWNEIPLTMTKLWRVNVRAEPTGNYQAILESQKILTA
jgi:hypothetical protein